MQLWTIQTEEAWQTLQRRGQLRCRRGDADRDLLPAYEWMAWEMVARLGPPKIEPVPPPLWAWYQYENCKHRRPDLRRAGHLPRGTRGYRIAFTIPDESVLLSDFELWHYVLNYWYLPRSESDANQFEARYQLRPSSWSSPPQDCQYDRLVRKSWSRIFDLQWHDRYVAAPRSEKSIQASFWQLDLGQVTKADRFVAR